MFSWAQQTFDKLSQTVAPPPTDGAGRYSYCVQRNDEAGAMGCITELDPVATIVNHAKGQYPIHLASEACMFRLVKLLMNQPGANVEITDAGGNTPMHYAAKSTDPQGLEICKLLIKEYGASVMTKNSYNQTPYDVSSLTVTRQYLLPIQLQAETQHALDNGGVGLPPGIDLGGLRIQNAVAPPPPMHFGAGGPSVSAPAPPMPFPTQHQPDPTVSAPVPAVAAPPANTPVMHPGTANQGVPPIGTVAPAPASSPSMFPPSDNNGAYARVGGSSAAIAPRSVGGTRFIPNDGFHSSSSDVNLQKKYGHSSVSGNSAVPPPPSSGGSNVTPASMSSAAGANPFAAGAALGGSGARYGSLPPPNRRYVAYGPTTPAPAPNSQPLYQFSAPTPMAAGVTMFTPGQTAQNSQQQQPVPFSAPTASQQQLPTETHISHAQEAAPGNKPLAAEPTADQYQQSQSIQPALQTTPTTPFMPPPPFQSVNYSQPQSTQQQPALGDSQQQQQSASQSDLPMSPPAMLPVNSNTTYAVSPADATYGSAVTPGASIATPGISKSPAGDAVTPGNDPTATELFSSPHVGNLIQSSVASSANVSTAADNVFAAPPVLQSQVPSSLASGENASAQSPLQNQATTSIPAVGNSAATADNVFAAPSPLQNQANVSPTKLEYEQYSSKASGDNGMSQQPVVSSQQLVSEDSTRVNTSSAAELFGMPSAGSNNISDAALQGPTALAPSSIMPQPQQISRTASAEEVFGGQSPSAQQPHQQRQLQQQSANHDGVQPLEPGTGGSQVKRTQSAEELFASSAPVANDSIPETKSQGQTFGGTVSGFGSGETVPNSANADAVFGEAAAFGAGAGGGGSAEEVFGAPPCSAPAVPENAEHKKTESDQPLDEKKSLDEADCAEEDMTDVPLSPGTDTANGETKSEQHVNTSSTNGVSTQPMPNQDTAVTASAESLFAAIGMPPPPFSAKKR